MRVSLPRVLRSSYLQRRGTALSLPSRVPPFRTLPPKLRPHSGRARVRKYHVKLCPSMLGLTATRNAQGTAHSGLGVQITRAEQAAAPRPQGEPRTTS
jgi:hypothetical protein